MPTIWSRKYGFQLRVSHKLLPKDFWATIDTRDAAEQHGRQLEALLAQGIVPAALLERGNPSQPIWTIQRCVTDYLRNNAVPDSEAHGAQVAQVFNPLDDIELLLEWNVLDLGRMAPMLRNQCQFERYEGCF